MTSAIESYNASLIKEGKGGNNLQINNKDDLKKTYQNFMLLLMTQLKNQDPMEPVKNEDFITQLVQFSLVEQSLRSNETQDKVLNEQKISQLMNASNFIGKEVEISDRKFEHTEGSSSKLGYVLPKEAAHAKMMISDESGKVVNTHDIPVDKNIFQWDGKTDENELLPTGKYSFEIIIKNEKGTMIQGEKNQPYKVDTSVYNVVKGVVMDKGMPKIKTGESTLMPLQSILSIQTTQM